MLHAQNQTTRKRVAGDLVCIAIEYDAIIPRTLFKLDGISYNPDFMTTNNNQFPFLANIKLHNIPSASLRDF